VSLGQLDAALNTVLSEEYNSTGPAVSRCTVTNITDTCSSLVLITGPTALISRVTNRAASLVSYWQSTSWIVAAAIAMLSFIAVETMPKTPAVGIAIMDALLLSAGRIHFACIVSSMNARLSDAGMSINATVDMNVYIVGTISIVIGLAWGAAVIGPRKHRQEEPERRLTTEMGIILEVGDYCNQTFAEVFQVLIAARLLEPFLRAGLIVNADGTGHSLTHESCAWNMWGKSNLKDGVYTMSRTAKDMVTAAQVCADQRGCIKISNPMEQRRVVPSAEMEGDAKAV
jgi:hypothetical protein